MEQQTMAAFVLFCLASLSGVLASRCIESTPLNLTAANRVVLEQQSVHTPTR
jgi:hypothetical protein